MPSMTLAIAILYTFIEGLYGILENADLKWRPFNSIETAHNLIDEWRYHYTLRFIIECECIAGHGVGYVWLTGNVQIIYRVLVNMGFMTRTLFLTICSI